MVEEGSGLSGVSFKKDTNLIQDDSTCGIYPLPTPTKSPPPNPVLWVQDVNVTFEETRTFSTQ